MAAAATCCNSKPSCCPEGSVLYLAPDYTAKGRIEVLDGMNTYIVGSGAKAIIVMYEIFGLDSGRMKLICDQFSEAGYLVMMPDFFRGDRWHSETDLTGLFDWVKQYTWDKVNADLQDRVYPYIKSQGIQEIGMVGTCWGSWALFQACASDKIKVGVNYHPTLFIGPSTPEELAENVNCPQMILPGGNDPENVKEGGAVEKILKTKAFGDKVMIKTFPDQPHGWVPRADIKIPENEKAVREAMELGINYIKENL